MKNIKKNEEMKIYGRHACLKVFEQRPQTIVRAYITQESLFEFKAILRYCSDKKLAYHIVTKEELNAISKATHHENITLIVKVPPKRTVEEMLNVQGRRIILALEEVENPHNLGAILRTAAHFGVHGICYQAKVPVAQSGAALRTSEGGSEFVQTLQLEDWETFFKTAQKLNFQVFATSGHEGVNLFDVSFPEKTVVFLGAEGEGLSNKMLKRINKVLKIPGTGNVESLNVSNANTAILTEWYRQGLKTLPK